MMSLLWFISLLLLLLSAFASSGVPDGTPVVLNPCGSNAELQQWDISHLSSDSTIRLKTNPTQCLDIYGYSTVDGSVTDVWTCHPEDTLPAHQNQEWAWNMKGAMVSKFGPCLDDLYMGSAPGSTVGIWSCNGGTNQQWIYNSTDYTILGVYSGMCLSAKKLDYSVTINGKNFGRKFDGIGGLSGGGATSRFLPSYANPYQSQILDFLFKPNFGASLHMLKVEIGGDTQSTEGTEASHMHTRTDENYDRGYEWWLMEEAKKRNPDILIYGLAWGVPGWIGNGNFFSQDNVDYHVKWINGAQKYHNVAVDYVGIWNEKSYTIDYVELLRKGLDAANLKRVQIVANDRDWSIVPDLQKNKSFSDSIAVVGVHYPGTSSPPAAQKLPQKLWASEDDATDNGETFARIINQNYVNGYMTSTIHWNLITAYYDGLQFSGSGLMAAQYPWTGNYEVLGPIWAAAHTTQFTKVGWIYLGGSGVGNLAGGGTYVTLVPSTTNPSGDFTMVFETMEYSISQCRWGNVGPYTVTPQNVSVTLSGGLNPKNSTLHLWCSDYAQKTYFQQLPDIKVLNNQFTLFLGINNLCTVTTTTGQRKGTYPAPPAAAPFPTPYKDNFDDGVVESQPKYFTDQTGSFAFYKQSPTSSTTVRQVVTVKPIAWNGDSQFPVSIIGDVGRTDYNVTCDVLIEGTGSGGLAGHITNIAQNAAYNGYYFLVANDGSWKILEDQQTVRSSGKLPSFDSTKFHTISLVFVKNSLTVYVDGVVIPSITTRNDRASGWAGIISLWNYAQFDNFFLV